MNITESAVYDIPSFANAQATFILFQGHLLLGDLTRLALQRQRDLDFVNALTEKISPDKMISFDHLQTYRYKEEWRIRKFFLCKCI
jgi:uncharacterized protein (DUF1684 family)